jgi:hypothetical protein
VRRDGAPAVDAPVATHHASGSSQRAARAGLNSPAVAARRATRESRPRPSSVSLSRARSRAPRNKLLQLPGATRIMSDARQLDHALPSQSSRRADRPHLNSGVTRRSHSNSK